MAPADVATAKVSGAALIALACEVLTGREHLRETKALMRFVLSAYLGDRPLASRELFRAASGGALP